MTGRPPATRHRPRSVAAVDRPVREPARHAPTFI